MPSLVHGQLRTSQQAKQIFCSAPQADASWQRARDLHYASASPLSLHPVSASIFALRTFAKTIGKRTTHSAAQHSSTTIFRNNCGPNICFRAPNGSNKLNLRRSGGGNVGCMLGVDCPCPAARFSANAIGSSSMLISTSPRTSLPSPWLGSPQRSAPPARGGRGEFFGGDQIRVTDAEGRQRAAQGHVPCRPYTASTRTRAVQCKCWLMWIHKCRLLDISSARRCSRNPWKAPLLSSLGLGFGAPCACAQRARVRERDNNRSRSWLGESQWKVTTNFGSSTRNYYTRNYYTWRAHDTSGGSLEVNV